MIYPGRPGQIRGLEGLLMRPAGRRPVHFGRDQAPLDTPVIERAAIGQGERQGPLIIESYDSTIVVPPGWAARADRLANILLDRP